MIPYVGPMVSTLGGKVLEDMKNLNVDSTAEEAQAVGISNTVWNSIPGEGKEQVVKKLTECAKYLSKLRK